MSEQDQFGGTALWDVEVRSGKEHTTGQGLANLWRLWERLASAQRP